VHHQRRVMHTSGNLGENARMSLPERLLLSWLSNAIMLAVADLVLTNVTVTDTGDLIFAAALFGILNTFLKPIVRLLTLPLAVVTLGVAWFFVSMLMLWLTQAIVSGFTIHGFWTLVWATLIVWAVDMILDILLRPRGRIRTTG
jgi:putative membrane protein